MNKKAHEQDWAFNELQALHTSERLHQLILDHAHDLIAIHKADDLSCQYVNPAALKVLGYTQEELFACSPLELIHPSDVDKAVARLRESLPKGLGQDEIRYRKKDGSYVWLEVIGTIMPTEAEHAFITIIARDITDRKQSEEALRKDHVELELMVQERTAQLNQINEQLQEKIIELMRTEKTRTASENYYRTIFENTGAATLISEEDMTISMVNEEWQNFLGYEKEDLVGSKWTQIVPAVFAERMKEYHRMRRLDPTAAPRKYPCQLIDKQGKLRDGLCTVATIPGTKDSVATFVDMTDYKRIDRALKAISAVNMAIGHAEKEYELLETVCRKIVEVGGYSLAWVGYVQAGSSQKVKAVAYAGRDNGYLNKLNISLTDPKRGQGPTGTAIRTGQAVISRNLKNDPIFKPWSKDALRRGLKSSMAIPLTADNQVFGALNIYADEVDFFDSAEEKLIMEMANDLAYAIISRRAREDYNRAAQDLGMSLQKMQRILMQAVTALGTALNIRDPYTAGHQKKVVHLATAIAQEMGFTKDQIEGITVAGNLHDIGKINVPSEILSKPGKLSDLEYKIIATHCQAGYEIVKEIEFPWPVAEVILQHHERMDGSGYPRNLPGEKILLEARIMAVADVVEAMASHRPYRAALGIDVALNEISSNSGKLYDPDVVNVCLKLFREKGFRFE